MNNKEVSSSLLLVSLVAAIVGIIMASLIIKGPGSTTVASVPAIPSSFPDTKNDSQYNTFLIPGALDPTQALPVGSSQNNSPFSGT